MNGIPTLERRMAGLRELIARRKSQGANERHIAAAERELHDTAIDYVCERCRADWDPLEVIRRMSLKMEPEYDDEEPSEAPNKGARISCDAEPRKII